MGSGGFDAVLDHLTTEILEGRIGPGSRLPNERELAAHLEVSRSAVREAIKVFQAQGVITSHTGPGRGTRVTGSQGDALGRILKLHVALDVISFDEVTETRVVLERAAAMGAAEHRRDEGLAQLRALAEEMVSATEISDFNALDTRFHVAIASLAANRLIRDLTIAIREAVALHILAAEREMDGWPELRTRLIAEHDGIVEALTLGDGALAADRCEAHIRGAHRAFLETPSARGG
jgi:DNA-binding FadR family transcriptional regulator